MRSNLRAANQTIRALRAPALVVAVSALVALLFTIATRPAVPERPGVASEARVSLLRDEHALIAAHIRADLAAQQAETERARAEMRAMASAQANAPETMQVRANMAKGASASVQAVALPPPKPVGPPLQLQAAIQPAPQVRRPVAKRAQEALATVGRIPGLVRTGVAEVADWAILGPVRTIARLPERRFL